MVIILKTSGQARLVELKESDNDDNLKFHLTADTTVVPTANFQIKGMTNYNLLLKLN